MKLRVYVLTGGCVGDRYVTKEPSVEGNMNELIKDRGVLQ